MSRADYQVGDKVEVLMPDGWTQGIFRGPGKPHPLSDEPSYRVTNDRPPLITNVPKRLIRRANHQPLSRFSARPARATY